MWYDFESLGTNSTNQSLPPENVLLERNEDLSLFFNSFFTGLRNDTFYHEDAYIAFQLSDMQQRIEELEYIQQTYILQINASKNELRDLVDELRTHTSSGQFLQFSTQELWKCFLELLYSNDVGEFENIANYVHTNVQVAEFVRDDTTVSWNPGSWFNFMNHRNGLAPLRDASWTILHTGLLFALTITIIRLIAIADNFKPLWIATNYFLGVLKKLPQVSSGSTDSEQEPLLINSQKKFSVSKKPHHHRSNLRDHSEETKNPNNNKYSYIQQAKSTKTSQRTLLGPSFHKQKQSWLQKQHKYVSPNNSALQ